MYRVVFVFCSELVVWSIIIGLKCEYLVLNGVLFIINVVFYDYMFEWLELFWLVVCV